MKTVSLVLALKRFKAYFGKLPHLTYSLVFILSLFPSFAFPQFADSGIDDLGTYLYYGTSMWGDYDNDGDLDILLGGYRNNSKIFKNNGGEFTALTIAFPQIGYKAAWIDYDNDNDLDIFLGGRLYKNQGGDIFTEMIIDDLNAFEDSDLTSLDVVDYDNDGDDDLLTGYKGHILILNNYNGKFLLVDQDLYLGETSPNSNINYAWMDADNDGYFDIMTPKLFKNNNYNLFLHDQNFNVNNIYYGLGVGDYDNNGSPDALFSGHSSSVMMKNSGGSFTNANLVSLQNVSGGHHSKFGDFNNDGLLDFILLTSNNCIVYLNDGSGDFSTTTINTGRVSCEDFGDFDDDGDLDLLMVSEYGPKIYENTLNNNDIPPGIPSNLQTSITGNSVAFSWTRPTDDKTPNAGLTFSIYLKNTTSGIIIKSPRANLTNGFLLEPGPGNIQNNNFWNVKGLNSGNYEWKVQAIDHCYQGSQFASGTFTITPQSTVSPSATQTLKPNETGNTLTVTATGATSRQWVYSIYPGGPYNNIITGQTATTYTPQFPEDGRYFVICKSLAGTETLFSNEILVEVLPFTETIINTAEIPNYYWGTIEPGDSDNDGDMDMLVTGDLGTKLYVNTNNNTFSDVSITSGLYYSDAEWFDYNNDNKLDFIITGSVENSVSSARITKIFISTGVNTFTELAHDIIGLAYGSVNVGDYDHDGDPDILINGLDVEPTTKIYRNDNGTFTDINVLINQVTDGMAIWGDYDNDDDLDIFMSGTDFSGNPYTGLYRNDGDMGFQQVEFTFKPCRYSFAEFGDYDNDNDIDILLAGEDVSSITNPVIYKNLGDDQFQEITSFTDRGYNYVRWFDYNNDNLLDILLVKQYWYSRSGGDHSRVHRILKNYGNDVFNEIIYQKSPVNNSQLLALAHMDNDSDVDILQSSYNFNTDTKYISVLYNESYLIKALPSAPANLNSLRRGKEILLTWDKPVGSSDKSISYDLMIGLDPDNNDIVTPLSKLDNGYRLVAEPGLITDNSYKVTIPEKGTYNWKVQAIDNSFRGSPFSGTASFTIGDYFVAQANPFIPVRYQVDSDWGDYDNDGDQDLLFCGKYVDAFSNWVSFSYVYQNTGNGTFNSTPVKDLGYEAYELKWIDLDNDNDLDIASCGPSNFVIFENQGAGIFTEVLNTYGSYNFSYGDHNNDGLIDLMPISNKLLINHGGFSFEEIWPDIGPYRYKTGYCFNDINNDLQKDLIVIDRFDNKIKLIKRTENGYEIVVPDLPAFYDDYTDFDLGDIDNDGDLDIIISGYTTAFINETILLRNNNNMNFSEVGSLIRGAMNGSVSLGDYDNDNDLDILLSGDSFSVITKIYENKGNFSFEEIDYALPGQSQGITGWSDYDEDGDLDVIIGGTSAEGYIAQSKLYTNKLNIPAAPVYTPDNLTAAKEGLGIVLSWKDNQNTGVSYNVRVGTDPGTCDIVSPMSDLNTGKRKVARLGNADLNLSYQLNTLPVDTYYWSVQAVNGAFKGSSWAPEQQFTITVVNAAFTATEACFGTSTQFTDNTLVQGESIVSWHWDFGDGQTSTDRNPLHLYSDADEYLVTLTVNTQNYSDAITKSVTVNPKPSANFTATTVCQGASTSLTNTTNTNGLSIPVWSWSFGDGNTFIGQNPLTHTYSFAGDYTVSLGVTATNGCSDQISKTVTVASYPVVAISADGATSFCSGQSVTLSTTPNAQYTFSWKRDGNPITGANTNSYLASISGNYTVDVTNTVAGCLTNSSGVNVTANTSPAAPLITALGPLTFCQGQSVDLSVTYTSGYTYQWKLNGGAVGTSSSTYSASASGTYSLEVANASGCKTNSTNTVDVTVNSNPSVPAVNISGPSTFCQGNNVELSVTPTGGYTYQWENNTNPITGAITSSYVANSSGVYALKITNPNNCFSRTENVNVSVLSSPAAPTITASGPTTFCQDGSILLSVDNTPGYSYQWKLNGGTVGSNTNAYTASASGTYNLTVTNASNCSVSSSNNIAVTVNPKPALPTVNISGPTAFCQGGNVELSVTSTPGYEYQWENGGTGITGAIFNSYSATSSGNYVLRITNSYGCPTKTENVAVTVATAPSAPLITAAGALTFCQGDSVDLSVTPGSDLTYQWKLNGGTIGANAAVLKAKNAGTYSLTVSNSIGCASNSTNNIAVAVNAKPSIPTVNLSGPTSFCQGGSVELSVASTSGYTYQWENSSAALSGASSNNLLANTSGVYALRITNTDNCFIKTENVSVNVLTVPSAPTISAASATSFCQGDSVLLSVTSTPGYSYQWRLNGGSVGTNSNQLVAKTSGSYDIVVSNSSGCIATSVVPVAVVVKPLPSMSIITVKGEEKFCSGETANLAVPANSSYDYAWKKGTSDLGLSTNSIDVAESGDYSVEVNLDGCKLTSEPVNITVVEKPAKPDIDPGSYNTKTVECLGENPVILSVDNIVAGYSYQWYKNETPLGNESSIEVVEAGNYYLESVFDICRSEKNNLSVTFLPAPPKPEIIAKGPTVWMLSTTSKGANYKWFYNGSAITEATGSSYMAGQKYGLYRLAVANETGCYSFSDTLRIPTFATTGIEDPDPFADVKIYPNPTTGMFTIEMNNNIFGELVIDIITQNGSKILNIKFEKSTEHFSSQIDLSGQPNGMYLINLSLDKFKTVRKVLVE